MGRYALTAPTPSTLPAVIAALKPAKRLEWQAAAAKEGVPFTEYVVRRVSANVRERKKKTRRRDARIRKLRGVRETHQDVEVEVEEVEDEAARRRRGRWAAEEWRARSPVSPNTPLTIAAMLSRFAVPRSPRRVSFWEELEGEEEESDDGDADHGVRSRTSSQGAVDGGDSVRCGSPLPSPGPLVEEKEVAESIGDLESASVEGIGAASSLGVIAKSVSDDQDVVHDSIWAPRQPTRLQHPTCDVHGNSTSAPVQASLSNSNSNSNSAESRVNGKVQVRDSNSSYENAQRRSPPRLPYGLSDLSHPLTRPPPDPSWVDSLAAIEEPQQQSSDELLVLPSKSQSYLESNSNVEIKKAAEPLVRDDVSANLNLLANEKNDLLPFSTQQLELEVQSRRERKGKKRKLEDEEPRTTGKMQKQEDADTPSLSIVESGPSRSSSIATDARILKELEEESCSIDLYPQHSVKEQPAERKPFKSPNDESNPTSVRHWPTDVSPTGVAPPPGSRFSHPDSRDRAIHPIRGALMESQGREQPHISLPPIATSPVDSPTPPSNADDEDLTPVELSLDDAESVVTQRTPMPEPLDPNAASNRTSNQKCEEAEPSPTSTIFHTAANSPWVMDEFHDSIPVMPTQQWQEFLDSSQGEALFPPNPSDSLPTPGSSTPAEKSDVQKEVDVSRFRLDINAVPLGATSVIVIRRGYVPGFHFDRPYWLNDEKDQYEVFALDDGDVEGAVREANEYINHRPDSCKPRYSMCFQKCKAAAGVNLHAAGAVPVTAAAVANQTAPLAAPIDEKAQRATSIELSVDEHTFTKSCSGCERPVRNKRAILCESCSACPSRDSLLEDTIKRHRLCEEQANILRQAAQGLTIFFTGPAGTGKSRVLCAMQEYLRRRMVVVDVISPTGITALNVGGRTIHSYAGWTPHHDEYPREKLERQARKKLTWKRLDRTETLIIDEISMVSCFTFTRLDWIMRAARKDETPFGGVQIIIAGDFFQLPPVKPWASCMYCGLETTKLDDDEEVQECKQCSVQFFDSEKFAFSSPTWLELELRCIELKKVHRQDDREFVGILNKLRIGNGLTASEENALHAWGQDVNVGNAIRLTARRDRATSENTKELQRLPGSSLEFSCLDNYDWNEDLHPYLKGSFDRVKPKDQYSSFIVYSDLHRMDDVLNLKVGMPVILLTNRYTFANLANGSRGKITGFQEFDQRLVPRMKRDSKDRSHHGEPLLNGPHAQYQQDNIRQFIDRARCKKWPVVQFDDGPIETIFPHCEVQELGIALDEATQERWSLRSRTQIPLLPGWAITIHRSQGMTLDRAVVGAGPAWEKGQVYTAMSRVRSLAGLKLTSMGCGKALQASEVVKRFHEKTFGKSKDRGADSTSSLAS